MLKSGILIKYCYREIPSLRFFFSFLGSEMETSALKTNGCLLIQCTKFDTRFIEQDCSTITAQICNKTRK